VSTTPVANLPPVLMTPVANCRRYQRHRRQILPPVPLLLLTPVANNGNNIRLLTHESELEGKNLYIRFLYYPKVTKLNFLNFSDCRFFPFAIGVVDTGGKP
jgi:hypothetical protein